MKTNSLPKVLVALFAACLLSYFFISCKESEESLAPKVAYVSQIKQNDLSKAKITSNHYIEDETVKGNYELRNGTLHFRNAESYFKTLVEFGKMKPEERLAASKAMGLKSLLEVQHDFILEAERISNDESKKNILVEKYSDILSTDETKLSFTNIDMVSAALINKSGIVYLGKSLRRYKGMEQTNIENGDESLLNDTNNPLVKTNKYLFEISPVSNSRVGSTCSKSYAQRSNGDNIQYNYLQAFTGNRAIRLDVFAFVDDWGSGTKVVTPYAVGYPFKKVFNNWYGYNTVNDLACFWECTVTSDFNNTQVSVANFSYSNDWDYIDYSGDGMFFFYALSFSTSFNLTYNGNTSYSSRGIGTPVIATCD